jgi:uncharacterized coiled-coil protein SlyX
MWPWTRSGPAEDNDARLTALASEVKALRLEWEDTYERLSRLLERLRKRDERAAKAEPAEEPDRAPAARAAHPKADLYRLLRERTNGVR